MNLKRSTSIAAPIPPQPQAKRVSEGRDHGHQQKPSPRAVDAQLFKAVEEGFDSANDSGFVVACKKQCSPEGVSDGFHIKII